MLEKALVNWAMEADTNGMDVTRLHPVSWKRQGGGYSIAGKLVLAHAVRPGAEPRKTLVL